MPDIFEDMFTPDDFLLDPEDSELQTDENWDTGIPSDIFASGEVADIFTTKD